MLLIPFDPSVSSSQEFRVDLGGKVATIDMAWNIRDSAWYMDIKTDTGEQDGIRVSPWTRLILNDDLLGVSGNLFAIKDGNEDAITYDNLGSDFNLYWFDSDDLKELEE